MLQELSIRNFAIIDDLHIRFSDGLTILSGETGAGKSIIINAVNLLLGGRVTQRHIRTGSDTAELEAMFHIAEGSKVADALRELGYDPAEGLLIRRVISRKNRHGIYLNGHLATAGVLSTITENLASISGQHANQRLLREEHHLQTLDQFGDLVGLRSQVHDSFDEIMPLIHKLQELRTLQDRQAEQVHLLQFQRNEILDAATRPGEDEELEQERKRLKHGEQLHQAALGALGILYDDPGAVVERLSEVRRDLDRVTELDPVLVPKSQAIAEATIHLEDITENLRSYLNTLELDEGRLEIVEDRLFLLQKLKRKYGESLEGVLAHLGTINSDLMEIENISDRISDTEGAIATLNDRLRSLALRLSRKRQRAADILSKRVEKELSTLGMADTRFAVLLEKNPSAGMPNDLLRVDDSGITDTGIDRASFLIAPNVGEALKPLASIVSGGELSRVVLALKAILAERESVETVVFDEVDAGIGGTVAEVVGRKLSSLSRHYQTICITHLPQIARFGDHHIRIFKRVDHGRTFTVMQSLGEAERIEEIARMLGGLTITEATRRHARELLSSTR